MIVQRLTRLVFVPLTALVLGGALLFLIADAPTAMAAAGTPVWQQGQGTMPMTHTMPMTNSTSPMMNHKMQQGQGMMGEGRGMMGNMPMTDTMSMHQSGMGNHRMGRHMIMMGRHMQMMGMMMQMMGHMHEMMDAEMGMMRGNMPMTHTMPMTGSMGMGGGMGMGMMNDMPMMEMRHMHEMMDMMKEMHHMHGMMGMMNGSMDHAMNPATTITDTVPVTDTASAPATTNAVSSASPQTVQVGPIEIKVTPLNLQDADAGTIDFTVELNSHTREIDLDLAQITSLTIGDTSMKPTAWETATPKGHHVSGVLHFPRTSEDGSALIAEATEISLVIGGLPGNNVRTLTWQISAQ